MTRLAVSVNLPAEHETTRNLSRMFSAIHGQAGAVNVQCAVCKTRGRDNSKIARGRKRTVCADCRRAGVE